MATTSHHKTRFSPSPTGLMHLGNLRTALFNVLLAKRLSTESATPATFLLRIEDTDLTRSEKELSDKLMSDLKWMGCEWQEGPNKDGGKGPYYQSERNPIYEKYYQQLINEGRAYWCFCTQTELAIINKSQLAAGIAPRYPGTCRHLTQEQIDAKKAKGLKPALRFRIAESEMVKFEDFIQGEKNFSSEDIGDFIIQKNDDSASFMFCNAVDDSLMDVTHVMRGEDHLTNTPRQLLILKALKLKAPQYGHMPLILGFDGKPLSKRNGSQSVEALREQGYFPIAIVNYLSRLGHHFESENTLMTLEECGKHFSSSHIGRAPARFDLAQLNHWQKELVLKKSADEIWHWLNPIVKEWVPAGKAELFTQTVMLNIVLPHDAQMLAKQLLTNDFIIEELANHGLKEAGDEFLDALSAAIEELAKIIRQSKQLYQPRQAKKANHCFYHYVLQLQG